MAQLSILTTGGRERSVLLGIPNVWPFIFGVGFASCAFLCQPSCWFVIDIDFGVLLSRLTNKFTITFLLSATTLRWAVKRGIGSGCKP